MGTPLLAELVAWGKNELKGRERTESIGGTLVYMEDS